MTKSQKIWLTVSAGLFLIPEILWSPIINFTYSFVKPTIHGSAQIFRDNFLINLDNTNLILLILFLQNVGLSGIKLNRISSLSNAIKKYSVIESRGEWGEICTI